MNILIVGAGVVGQVYARHLARAGAKVTFLVKRRGERVPLVLRLASTPLAIRTLLLVAPHLVAFDLETYLRVHFTKVGDPTRDTLRTFGRWAEEAGDSGASSMGGCKTSDR